MENRYEIGGHEFQTQEEYNCAKKDYEYIQEFMEKLDLKKPEKARELYDRLKNSKHLMKSEVGEAFKNKLVQIFVSDEVKRLKKEYDISPATVKHAPKLIKKCKERIVHFCKWLNSKLRDRVWGLMLIYSFGHFLSSILTLLEKLQFIHKTAVYVDICVIIYSIALLGYLYYQQIKKVEKSTSRIRYILVSGLMLFVYLWILG